MASPWKQICSIKEDYSAVGLCLEAMFRGYPGGDSEICFWKERWLFEVPLCDKFPTLFQLESNRKAFIKERVVVGSEGLEPAYMWSRLPISEEELSELHSLNEALKNYQLGQGSDSWCWIMDNSGSFSVSGVKEKLQRAIFPDLNLTFEWNNWSPKKVNFMIWRLIQDKLPTYAALARRNVIVQDNCCKMCGEEVESALHLFASCSIADQIWEFISRWCRIRRVYALELKDLTNIHKCNSGTQRWQKVVSLVTQAALWVIWRSRNEAVFEGKQPRVNRMKEEIKILGYMWLKSRVKNGNISWGDWCNFDLLSFGV
ncbi:uncharacterized protein LOC110932299 [Helianthus annuus]|uniref:uncharacterized protein LOC110932299 n=1 Tax=Helianthus annuus TaxID=4232 RepID=UPI000B8F98E9|nr:uncharacterized protein LOC110932299 [Helianthus annuus]